jgi:DNA-binding transcriptional LysR family regulator
VGLSAGYDAPLMDLRRLRYFVALGEDLHFTRAAQRLHIAQPALSQAVRQLEREMNVDLFLRTRRNVELTPAGTVLLTDARKILHDVDVAVERAQAAQQGRTGILRIGFSDAAAMRLLPNLLREFAPLYPTVEVLLQPMSNATVIASGLAAGDIDLGLTGILESTALDAGLSFLPVEREPLVLALAADNPVADAAVVDLAAMRDVDLVLPARTSSPPFYDAILELWRAIDVKVNVVAEAATLYAQLGFIASGMGVAIVPAGMGRWGVNGATFRPTVQPLPSIEFGIGWSEDYLNAIASSFLELGRSLVEPPLAESDADSVAASIGPDR